MKQRTEEWLSRARADVQGARILLAGGGDDGLILFLRQQAIEKTLKAIWVERREDEPQRTHSLPGLVSLLGLQVGQERAELFRHIDALYLRSRYPDEAPPAGDNVEKTEDSLRWLYQQLS